MVLPLKSHSQSDRAITPNTQPQPKPKVMNKKPKTQQLRIINRAWENLARALGNISMTNYGKVYLRMNTKEEKEHRGISGSRGMSVPQAAKFMAVRQIVAAVMGRDNPEIRDCISTNPSVFYAHSLWENFPEEIKTALAGFDLSGILEMDYAELVK